MFNLRSLNYSPYNSYINIFMAHGPHAKDDEVCFYTFIYTTSLLLVAWPFYLFLITEWYAQRHHFVIRNRWPKISLIVVALTIIIQILTILETTFCISVISNVSIGLSNAVQGSVYYRCYLLYAQTIKIRHYLAKMEPMIIQQDYNKGWYQNVGRLILFIIVSSSITITTCRWLDVYGSFVYIAFTLTLLIGVICLVNLIRIKVKDSIGITKECMIQITINLMMLLLVGPAPALVPQYIEINMWLGVLFSVCYGLSTLFLAYNLIRKGDVAKDAMPSSVKNPTPIRALSGSTVEQHQSTGLHVTHLRPADNESGFELPPLRDPESLNLWLNKPLWLFLRDHPQNLSLFIGYLCECFALENMLFLERAIILYHLIQKYRDMDDSDSVDDDAERIISVFAHPCYKLRFLFLTSIYNDIEAIIQNGCDDDDDIKYKRGIVEAMKLIHEQFCNPEADNEINIPYSIRNRLCGLFEAKTDNEILQQFVCYDDLLVVYH
eukprot:939546_1